MDNLSKQQADEMIETLEKVIERGKKIIDISGVTIEHYNQRLIKEKQNSEIIKKNIQALEENTIDLQDTILETSKGIEANQKIVDFLKERYK